MTHPTVLHVTDASFQADVLQADSPVFVDFWAQWCGPCKRIAPWIDELAPAYVGKIKFAKLNIDDSPMVAMKLGIRSIPTMIVFDKGQPMAKQIGAFNSIAQLQKFLDNQLA